MNKTNRLSCIMCLSFFCWTDAICSREESGPEAQSAFSPTVLPQNSHNLVLKSSPQRRTAPGREYNVSPAACLRRSPSTARKQTQRHSRQYRDYRMLLSRVRENERKSALISIVVVLTRWSLLWYALQTVAGNCRCWHSTVGGF